MLVKAGFNQTNIALISVEKYTLPFINKSVKSGYN